MTLTLTRLETSDQGTFGEILYGKFRFLTGELPWRENLPHISSIPVGHYYVEWTYSGKFKKYTYEVQRVPGRIGVRIHSANLMGDTSLGLASQLNGCIAIGYEKGIMGGQKALLRSREGLKGFETLMEREPFTLVVQ